MQAGGCAKGNEVELMDWELYLKEIVRSILSEQSPQALQTIRGKYYEQLAHLIPASVILKELIMLLAACCPTRARQMETVCWGATYEQKMRQGGKEIVFLEAFTARFMTLYKQALLKRCPLCSPSRPMTLENTPP